MVNHEEARVKIAKYKTKKILRITKKNFQNEELPPELFLTTRQKTKIRNSFANNMSMDTMLVKAQLFKIIQLGGFICVSLGKLAGTVMKIAIPLAKNVLAPLATVASASAKDGTIQRKTCVRGAIATTEASIVRAGRRITLVILNENMNDIIRIIKSQEISGVLINGVDETVKNETKKQDGEFHGI